MVRKRSDGRWEGRIVIGHKKDGTPMYKSVFGKTQKEALGNLHTAIELYRDVDLCEDSRMSLGKWLDRWLDEYMLLTVRESTLDGYRSMTENYIKPCIGEKPLAFLTTADLQKFYNKMKKEGRIRNHPKYGHSLSDSMVRKIHMMLHEAMDAAVRERLIVKNPTNGTTVPKANPPEKQIMTEDELDKFWETLKAEPLWYDFFYAELMTGLRRGEICGLKWTDINYEAGTLRVERSISNKKGGGVTIGDTKTDTGTRTIILPPSVLAMFIERKKNAICEWIFPHLYNPNMPMNPAAAYRKLKMLLKHAELPTMRFHDLRHTFATHATKGGVDAKTLAGILGHTNASFTLDTYTHVTADMQKNASEVVGKMMKNITRRKE